MSNESYPCHNTMEELCNELMKKGEIKSQRVKNALMKVDRADFIQGPKRYQNRAQQIPCNVVISAPHLHGYCLENLKDFLVEGGNVLDVGFGSGYLTVAMSKMMNDKGTVYGIEHMKELYNLGKSNIEKNHKILLDKGIIKLICDDGRKGYKPGAPYKCIHVGAGTERVPQELIDQLDEGGRLLIPIGKYGDQYIHFIDKKNGKLNYTKGWPVCYVELTSKEKQMNNPK